MGKNASQTLKGNAIYNSFFIAYVAAHFRLKLTRRKYVNSHKLLNGSTTELHG